MSLRVSSVLICFQGAYIYIYAHTHICTGVKANALLLIFIVLMAWSSSANS